MQRPDSAFERGNIGQEAMQSSNLHAAKHNGRKRACVYGTPEVPKL